jgi:hypothetical protein
MPHTFPSGLQTLIATGWYRVHPAIIATLGDGATVLKYSTLNITVGADTFVDQLKYAGPCKMSLTRAVDRVPIEIWNGDAEAGLAFIDPVEALDGAKASYYRIYGNPDDFDENYLIEEIAGVLVVDPGAGAGDETVEMTIVSDTAALPSIVGDRALQKSCVNRYKDGFFCPYSGPLPDCDRTFDGANGCTLHFGQEEALIRFGGHTRDLDNGTLVQIGGAASTPGAAAPAQPTPQPPPRYPSGPRDFGTKSRFLLA